MRRQVGNFSQAFSQSGGRSSFPAFLSISLKLKTAWPGNRIEEATGGGRQVGGPDAAVIPARSGLGSGLIEREAVDLARTALLLSAAAAHHQRHLQQWRGRHEPLVRHEAVQGDLSRKACNVRGRARKARR